MNEQLSPAALRALLEAEEEERRAAALAEREAAEAAQVAPAVEEAVPAKEAAHPVLSRRQRFHRRLWRRWRRLPAVARRMVCACAVLLSCGIGFGLLGIGVSLVKPAGEPVAFRVTEDLRADLAALEPLWMELRPTLRLVVPDGQAELEERLGAAAAAEVHARELFEKVIARGGEDTVFGRLVQARYLAAQAQRMVWADLGGAPDRWEERSGMAVFDTPERQSLHARDREAWVFFFKEAQTAMEHWEGLAE